MSQTRCCLQIFLNQTVFSWLHVENFKTSIFSGIIFYCASRQKNTLFIKKVSTFLHVQEHFSLNDVALRFSQDHTVFPYLCVKNSKIANFRDLYIAFYIYIFFRKKIISQFHIREMTFILYIIFWSFVALIEKNSFY